MLAFGDQVTGLMLKLPDPNAAVLGVAPVTGAVTIIATLSVGIEAVAGNMYDNVTVLPLLFVTVAVRSFIVAAISPVNV